MHMHSICTQCVCVHSVCVCRHFLHTHTHTTFSICSICICTVCVCADTLYTAIKRHVTHSSICIVYAMHMHSVCVRRHFHRVVSGHIYRSRYITHTDTDTDTHRHTDIHTHTHRHTHTHITHSSICAVAAYARHTYIHAHLTHSSSICIVCICCAYSSSIAAAAMCDMPYMHTSI